MKKTLLFKTISVLSFTILIGTVGLRAQTPFWTLDFESAGGYTTSVTEFTDNGGDFFLRTDGSDFGTYIEYANILGSYYFAGMDLDGEGASLPLELNIDDIDISGRSDLYFGIYLAEDDDGTNQDWDDADYVKIQYDIDNSGSFSDLIWIRATGTGSNFEPSIDANFDGTGDGVSFITNTFKQFIAPITGTGSTLDIKIIFSLNSGDEDIAMDNIQVLFPDTDPPVATFDPLETATDVYVTSKVTITFDEGIRNIDDSEITDANVSSLLTFKETNISGADVAFTPTIDANKKIITLTPDAYLTNNQVYYVAIAPVEDGLDNAFTGESITFTTIDGAGKEIAVEIPEGGETYYAGELATIEWYSNNVTTVNIDTWVPSVGDWVTMVTNTPSDGSESFNVPTDAGSSEEYMIRVIDVGDPLVFGVSPTFTVISTPTIYLIQSTITTGDVSDYAGHRVQTSGIVTAIDGGNFWLQDGPGAWNGIIGYDYDVVGSLAVGDDITVDADVAEYTTSGSSLTELVEISNLVINSSGNTLPEPTTITTGTYSEDFEGVLVKIVSADVTNADAGNGEFIINDGSGDLKVDDKIYKYTASLGETIGVTGIGTDEYGDKILPRSADDIVDLTAPTFTSVPDDAVVDVAIDASTVFTFSEAIRNIDDSEITDLNVGTLFTFKKTDVAGEDVSFTASIDAEKKVVTLVPVSNLDYSQLYYVGVASVEDANDNAMTAASLSYTTIADLAAPVMSSVPNDAATDVEIDVSVVLTFDEAIRNIDDSEITDGNVAALLTFKETDAAGADVAFTATIDAGKKVITITPSADLGYTQVYYVAISPVEDASDNATTLSSFTFTTADNTSSVTGLQTNTFDVFPNPSDGKFVIRIGFDAGIPMDLEITNILGRTVYRNRTFGLHSAVEVIDISDVAPGFYFVRVTEGQNTKIKRIMIK